MFNILTPFEELNKCIKKKLFMSRPINFRVQSWPARRLALHMKVIVSMHLSHRSADVWITSKGDWTRSVDFWMFPSRWCRSDRWAGWRCPTDRLCVQTLPSFIFKYLGLAALCLLDITQQPWTQGTRHVGAELTVTYTVSNDTILRKHEVTMQNTFHPRTCTTDIGG